jgi:hypothetical protein
VKTTTLSKWDDVLVTLRGRLEGAYKNFRHNPTANNWRAMTQAMLVWQQLNQVRVAERSAVADDLFCLPMGEWDQFIVHYVTGKKLSDLLLPINGA